MKKRILIIDDEAEYSSMLKAQLESLGYYEIAEENDETRAMAAAREFGPDLILLDVMMPNLDGSEVAAIIRKDVQLKDTPMLFLTALVSESDAPGGCHQNGGNVFFPKSMPIEKLLECIREATAGTRAYEVAT